MPRDPREVLEEDRVRLTHMLESAQRAMDMTAGVTREALERDTMRLLAVVKSIEVVGEASTKVSQRTKTRLSGIDWRGMRGMRNRLIHGYDTISVTVVWDTVQIDIPVVAREIESALATWPAP